MICLPSSSGYVVNFVEYLCTIVTTPALITYAERYLFQNDKTILVLEYLTLYYLLPYCSIA